MTKFLILASLCVLALGNWVPFPSPTVGLNHAAVTHGKAIHFVKSTVHKVYDSVLDTWTDKAALPTPRVLYGSLDLHAPSSRIYAAAGYRTSTAAPSNAFDVYSIASDTWTTLPSTPTACFATPSIVAEDHFFHAARQCTPDFYAFSITADTWTLKQSLPSPAGAWSKFVSDCATAAKFFLIGNNAQMLEYTIALDSWTTKTSVPVDFSAPAVACQCGRVYAALGSTTSSTSHAYDIMQDAWTSLTPYPVAQTNGEATFVGATLYAIHNVAATTYDTTVHGTCASVFGDPLFTSFDGFQHHLSLRPGVFNLLSAPACVVNALVESLDSLPAEENMVMTMIAIVWTEAGVLFKVICELSDTTLLCSRLFRTDQQVPPISFQQLSNSFLLQLLLGDIEVSGEALAVANVAGAEAIAKPIASFLNLRVHRRAGAPPVAGLLADLQSLTFERVRQRVSSGFYEGDGSVTDTTAPSVASLYD